jgi:hypothetical protein
MKEFRLSYRTGRSSENDNYSRTPENDNYSRTPENDNYSRTLGKGHQLAEFQKKGNL